MASVVAFVMVGTCGLAVIGLWRKRRGLSITLGRE